MCSTPYGINGSAASVLATAWASRSIVAEVPRSVAAKSKKKRDVSHSILARIWSPAGHLSTLELELVKLWTPSIVAKIDAVVDGAVPLEPLPFNAVFIRCTRLCTIPLRTGAPLCADIVCAPLRSKAWLKERHRGGRLPLANGGDMRLVSTAGKEDRAENDGAHHGYLAQTADPAAGQGRAGQGAD